MLMIYSSESFILLYLLLNPPQSQQLFGSFTLELFLCLFIILITVWRRDFWRSLIPNKIQQISFFNNGLVAQSREQPTYRIPEAKSLEALADLLTQLAEI